MSEKTKAMKHMYNTYVRKGQTAVEELFDKKYAHLGEWMDCDACDDMEPHIDNTCCVCWTEGGD